MRMRLVYGVFAAAGLVVAACGSDNGKSESTPVTTASAATTATTAQTSTAVNTAVAQTTVTDNTQGTATGGTAAGTQGEVRFSDTNQYRADVDRTGETIKIGVSNNEGPNFSTPEMRVGILTAFDFINDNGGVNGAKLEPVLCVSDATPEGAINCANQFVEANVNLVTYGTEVGIDAALPIYEKAGIAVISDYAYNEKQSKNVWALMAPLSSYALGPLQALQDIGAKKVAYLPLDTAFHRLQGKLTVAWGKVMGIDVIVGPPVDGGTGDWTPAIQTVLSAGADALVAHPPTNHVISIVSTARSLGFKGPILTSNHEFVQKVGLPDVLNTYTMSPRFQTAAAAAAVGAPQRIQDNLKRYAEVMIAAGHADLIEGYAENQFASMVDLGSILEMIPEGPINLDSIRAVLSEDRWVIGFDASDFNCGAAVWPADPSFCRGWQGITKIDEKDGKIFESPLKKENYGIFYDPALNAMSTKLVVEG